MTLPSLELVDGPISTERGSYLCVCADIDGERWDAAWSDDRHDGTAWGAEKWSDA